ncbi:RNA polymerase sigma factor [Splendidivirga corallicola]
MGDRKAQYKLYKLYSKAMYNICYRIANDAEDAEDILQESFVSAFRNLHTYRGESSFGAWLKKVVVNRAINHVKKKRLEIQPMTANFEYEDESDYNTNEDLSWNIEQIKSAVQELPQGYRIVFSLYLLEGYDHGEIAGILNISESTSKSQYNRAKKKLKEIIKNKAFHAG